MRSLRCLILLISCFASAAFMPVKANATSYTPYQSALMSCLNNLSADIRKIYADHPIPSATISQEAITQRANIWAEISSKVDSLDYPECPVEFAPIVTLTKKTFKDQHNNWSDLADGHLNFDQAKNLSLQIQENFETETANLVGRIAENSDKMPTGAIINIQTVLQGSGFTNVSASGVIDHHTEAALIEFLQILQTDPQLWGVGWDGQKDGTYSPEFGRHLRSVAANTEASGAISEFAESLDQLAANGLLHGPASSHTVTQATEDTPPPGAALVPESYVPETQGSFWAALFIPIFQGLTFEWGDELYCAQIDKDNPECRSEMTQIIYAYERDYGMLAMITTMIGVLASPVGVISVFYFNAKSKIEAFKAGFTAEIIEGAISALGIVSTHGQLESFVGFCVSTALAGILTGTAAMNGAKHK